ncbi:BON domain-containing protein [Massilia endophytica]|uniref:BON domain-containing protein n=1 Tax=Massilia endophytica TaxID=2899220 RepID=UPI001E34859E|nr:BON domain-containing protein [Massilia endophytica]UGQ45322.1 BON domain-containing protein [Massilia endophytica]
MKKLVFLTLATAASVAFAQNTDSAGYKAAHEKAEADYKVAKERCDGMKGNSKDVCKEEAKVARARAEANAVAQYKNNKSDIDRANRKLADAEYDLAKEKCDDLSGNAKDTCQAQAKAAKSSAIAGTTADSRTGVLVDNTNRSTVAANAADVRDRTAAAANTAADRTANAAENAKDKTVAAAHDMKEKTAEKTADASQAMSDTMITTKVKADMAADKTVKAMDVHVETQNGVVMLSGFVPTKAEADRAVQLAKGVKGVTDVKSSIQVKNTK